MSKILVVDDEPSLRELLSIFLTKAGHEVETAENGKMAIEISSKKEFDVVFTDLNMPGGVNGIDVLKAVRQSGPTQVIIITAFATTETAIEAMKLGAYDYIQKPFKIKEVEAILDKCLEKQALLRENVHLKSQLQTRYNFGNLIGKSPRMVELFQLLQKIVDTKANVLILGESGTGKELVARALHYNSSKKDQPFLALNCGAIPENLLESELFGHVKGAFTGADRDKEGLFKTAGQGTIFLDEVGEMPLHIQVKLLRVLQERQVRPLGSSTLIPMEARVISATNRNLAKEVKEGRFREDLYFRLNVLTLEMPSLKDRIEDVALLTQHFLEKFSQEMDREIYGISDGAMNALLSYDYPGNVRELENIMERAVLLEGGSVIQVGSLPPALRKDVPEVAPTTTEVGIPTEGLESFLEKIERQILCKALEETQGVQKHAAKLLQLTPRSFRYRLAKLNIQSDNTE